MICIKDTGLQYPNSLIFYKSDALSECLCLCSFEAEAGRLHSTSDSLKDFIQFKFKEYLETTDL